MATLIERMLKPENLNKAWLATRKEKGLWEPGVATGKIERDLVKHVGSLVEQIRAGKYRALPARCFHIDKPNGEKRPICTPYIRDKFLQRAALMVIQPLSEKKFHSNSYGYRPMCNTDMATSKIRERVRDGFTWLVDADIKGCFEHIPQDGALKLLQKLTGDRAMVALHKQWLAQVPEAFLSCGKGVGLPQGMVFSPLLANLYMDRMDRSLERMGIPFVRFADDFILFSKTRFKARLAHWYVERTLRGMGLILHPDKTRIIRSSPGYRFLGKKLPDARKVL